MPVKKRADASEVSAVVFISFVALCIGFGAGGHKDFSESLVANVGLALFDVILWSIAVVFWIVFLRKKWVALGAKMLTLKRSLLIVSALVLAGLYSSGMYISLWCLIVRAGASDY